MLRKDLRVQDQAAQVDRSRCDSDAKVVIGSIPIANGGKESKGRLTTKDASRLAGALTLH